MVATALAVGGLVALHLAWLCSDEPSLRWLGWGLAPAFWVLVVSGLRSLQVVHGHHAIHGTLIADSPRANAVAARLLTLLVVVQNEMAYERDHLQHHRRSVFTTVHDADACLLMRFGLQSGRPERVLRRALWTTTVSPAFHVQFLASRLQSNLRRPWPWCALAVGWIVALAVGLPLAVGWLPALIAVWLPLVVGYQASALLQFATEHVWLQEAQGAPCMASYALRCHGRFCGEPLPAVHHATLRAWARWWLRTVFIHVPTRLCVLSGDLPAHDWHHLCGVIGHRWDDWPSAIFERQRAIDTGRSAGMEHREVWGLPDMVSYVLRAMARSPQACAAPGEAHVHCNNSSR